MRLRLMVGVMLAITLASSTAHSHAALVQASPQAGATVSAAPKEVALTFTDKLEPAFSRVTVTDAKGAAVSEGNAQVDGNVIRVGLKALEPGSYKVNWRAVSADTHATQGSFAFQVGGK